MGLGEQALIQPIHAPCDRHSAQPCGVDQHLARQLGAVLCGHTNRMCGGALPHANVLHGRDQRQQTACVFHVALQGEHVAVTVNHPGAGREQRRFARQRRLQRLGPGSREFLQVVHAVGGGLGHDAVQRQHLFRRRGHDQLAQLPVRHTALGAIGVEHLLALHTQPRLERTRGVINARVDDLAVARAGACADGVFRFEHQHLAARERQRPPHSQPNHPGPDHNSINLFHGQHCGAGCGILWKRCPHRDRALADHWPSTGGGIHNKCRPHRLTPARQTPEAHTGRLTNI